MFFSSRGTLEPEELVRTMDEIMQSPDRSAAIVAGSLVENVLKDILIGQFHKDEAITKELFRSTGAFGPFATKIHMGKLSGLYGEKMHKELLYIKDIRNRFAHDLSVRSFENQQVAAWCKNLWYCERYTIDNNARPETTDPKGTPIAERSWWFGITDRDKTLREPRGRFLTSVSAVLYALSWPNGVTMPAPRL